MKIKFNNIKRPLLIVVQGAPAVGKTAVCETLQKYFIETGFSVTYLPWDIFHHFSEPTKIVKKQIIATTATMLSTAAQIIITIKPDIMLLDGVFAYSEEQTAITSLFEYVRSHFSATLLCEPNEQLYRNLSRYSKDYLAADRIYEVNSYLKLQRHNKSDITVDTTYMSIQESAGKILYSLIHSLNSVNTVEKHSHTTMEPSPSWFFANKIMFGVDRVEKWDSYPFAVLPENGRKTANEDQ